MRTPLLLLGLAGVAYAQNPTGTPVLWVNIIDNSLYVSKPCTNYNQAYFNAITGDIIRCTNGTGFNITLNGVWTAVSGGGGGGAATWGGISGILSNQSDLQSALNAKQNTLTLPLSVSNGGNGTASPTISAGANVTVSGAWPSYTISASGSGGAGSVAWGGITGTLSAQSDLQSALNAKQNSLTLPLSIANGGNGSATPQISAGSNISITGTWPSYTINSTGGGGGGGIASGSALPATCAPGTDTLFYKTNGTVNQQIYTCSALNTWTLNMLLGGSGALAINGTTGALDIVTTVVPRLTAVNAFTGRNSFTLSDLIQQAVPAAPAAGRLSLYANNDGSLHFINSAGTDSALAAGAGFANPMTTQDDVIVAGATGTPTRLARGADSQVLGVDPSTHHLAYLTQSGGGGGGSTPAGNSGDLQYNNAGALGGVPLRLFVSGATGNKLLFSPAVGVTSAALPAGETEPRTMVALEGNTVGQPMFSINNWVSTGYSQMYFYSSAAAQDGTVTHRYQLGVGNGAETGLGVANKMFIYDGGACTGTDSTCTGGRGLLWMINAIPATPVHLFNGTIQVAAQTANPVCAAAADIGKQWMDNTTAADTHFKVCANVASVPTWKQVF